MSKAKPLNLDAWVEAAARNPRAGCGVCRHKAARELFDLLCGAMEARRVALGSRKIAEKLAAETGKVFSVSIVSRHRQHSESWKAVVEASRG